MKFSPEALGTWRQRKIAVDRAIECGDMTAEKGQEFMRRLASGLMAAAEGTNKRPPRRHLRAVG